MRGNDTSKRLYPTWPLSTDLQHLSSSSVDQRMSAVPRRGVISHVFYPPSTFLSRLFSVWYRSLAGVQLLIEYVMRLFRWQEMEGRWLRDGINSAQQLLFSVTFILPFRERLWYLNLLAHLWPNSKFNFPVGFLDVYTLSKQNEHTGMPVEFPFQNVALDVAICLHQSMLTAFLKSYVHTHI